MSDKEVSEKRIDEYLTELIESEGEIDNISHVIRTLAKLLYNVRVDLDELKIHLKEVFSRPLDQEEFGEGDVLKYPNKEIKDNPERFYDDFYM